MKSFVFAAALLFAATASAQVPVGTWATYATTIVFEDGRTMANQETVTVLAVNADGTTLLESKTLEQDGTETVEQFVEKTDEIMSEQTGLAVVVECSNPQIGGTVESVTVKAGTFQSCKITDASMPTAGLWIGQAPFGILKMSVPAQTEENGNTVNLFLDRELLGFGKN